MLLIRDGAPRHVGQARMINIAAFDQPEQLVGVRVVDPQAASGAAGAARYGPQFDGLA